MKYLKTFESYQDQINAGNTANSAPMNVTQSTDKEPGIGDSIMFWYVPDSNKPNDKVEASGKILSFLTNNNIEVTLNVENSDFNKPGVLDKNNSIVTVSKKQIMGAYPGLYKSADQGYTSANINGNTGGGGGGIIGTGANDVSVTMKM